MLEREFAPEDDSAGRGIGVVALHASEAGRPVYELLGFRATSEMLLVLPDLQAER